MKPINSTSSKKIKNYMALSYPITIEQDIDSDNKPYFKSEITDLPGCSAHGETVDEALKGIQDAKIAWIKTSLSKGLEIPIPETEDQYSGKILLRIPVKLHMQLAKNAKKDNVSLNQYIRRSLEQEMDLQSLNRDVQALKMEMINRLNEIEKNMLSLNASICNNFLSYPQQPAKQNFGIILVHGAVPYEPNEPSQTVTVLGSQSGLSGNTEVGYWNPTGRNLYQQEK